MAAPTEAQVRAQLKSLAEEVLTETQVLDSWPFGFDPGDDMTVLRGGNANGKVDTLIIAGAAIEQSETPKDSVRGMTTPRGKNVVGRLYRTWLFNEEEAVLSAKIEVWRIKVNRTPKLGFLPGVAEHIESVGRLQVPAITDFPSGDPQTPMGWVAQGFVKVEVTEPQG